MAINNHHWPLNGHQWPIIATHGNLTAIRKPSMAMKTRAGSPRMTMGSPINVANIGFVTKCHAMATSILRKVSAASAIGKN